MSGFVLGGASQHSCRVQDHCKSFLHAIMSDGLKKKKIMLFSPSYLKEETKRFHFG